MNKKSLLSAFLTAIMIGGLTLASAMRFGTVQASANVSGIPKPSVPEFTLRYIDLSYDVPPTYGIDQYTGQNVTIQAGYHVDNRTMVFTIKNQPFTPYNDSSGNYIGLYYNFRFKGHYGNEWTYYPFDGGQTTHSYGPYSGGFFIYYSASNSDNTVLSIELATLTIYPSTQIPDGSQVDFQVQAQIGHIDPIPSGLLAGDFYKFTGESSDWSNTQTITIGESQTPTPSPATTPTPTPSQEPPLTPEEIEPIIGAAIIVAVISAGLGLLVYFIKRK